MPAAAKTTNKARASKQSRGQSVPINTVVSHELSEALCRYAKDKGLLYPQDVLRVAGTLMMRKEGYLKDEKK
jgi:hypothetical protein